jgi:ABC-type phosphate/phosphonate transport system substrate-binding protein
VNSVRGNGQATNGPRGSSRLLWLAIAATVAVGALYAAFLGTSMTTLGRAADTAAPTDTARSPLTVAMVRLVGGRAVWPHYVEALDHLGAELDRPVNTMFLYDGERAESIFGERPDLDGAFMSIYAYLLALELEPGLTRLVTPVIDGHEQEQAVVVVRADSDFKEIADLRGTRAALVRPDVGGSLAGNGYTRLLLDEGGFGSAERFFSTVEVGRSQEDNLRRVKDGTAEVTSVNRSQLASWPPGTFRVIARSQEYGMPPFVISPSLSDAEADTIIGALLGFVPTDGAGDTPLEGFVIAHPDQYEFPLVLLSYAQSGPQQPSSGDGR